MFGVESFAHLSYSISMKKADLFFAFILLPIDILAVFCAFVASYYLRTNWEAVPVYAADIRLVEYLRYSLYILPIWIVLFALHGLYYIRINTGFAREFYRIVIASSTTMLFLILGIFLSHTTFFSRLILVFTWVLSIAFIACGRLVIRAIRRFLYKYGIGRRNVILIGYNGTSEDVVNDLSNRPLLGYKVCGVIDHNGGGSKYDLKIIGNLDDLTEKIKYYNVDEVILTDTNLGKTKVLDIIQTCSDYRVTFKYIPDIFSMITLNVSSELIGSMPVMELKPIPLDGWARIVKRVIDVIFAAIFLAILSPIFLIVAVLEKLTSRGPIFYGQNRIGRDERPFKCFKFRTMYVDQCDFSKTGTKWSTAADEKNRVTPLGRFLRKSNIDEFPQLWNIFIGNMSFVGPRPEQPNFVKKFESEIPEYFKRHRVKAGLTGWAQVNGLKGDTSIKERVRYDIYYIENWSLKFDIKIIFRTIFLMIYEIFAGKYEYRSGS